MKVAIPNDKGEVHQHLGRCEEFVIYEIQEGEIKNGELMIISSGQNNYRGAMLALKEKGVNTLICGNIGLGTARALCHYGFKVIPGTSGKVEQAVRAFIRGELSGQIPTCQPCYSSRWDSCDEE